MNYDLWQRRLELAVMWLFGFGLGFLVGFGVAV